MASEVTITETPVGAKTMSFGQTFASSSGLIIASIAPAVAAATPRLLALTGVGT